jgi:AcrR family transcriptional regulator
MPGQKLAEQTRRGSILRAAHFVALRHGIGAITVRAVADRAGVSHGTVLFHFKRKSELVSALLDRILIATAVLRAGKSVAGKAGPSESLHAMVRAEIERLTSKPRHFRLFLEYLTVGLRREGIRRKIGVALDSYRSGFRDLAQGVVDATGPYAADSSQEVVGVVRPTAEGFAAVTVSFIHGAALHASTSIDTSGRRRGCSMRSLRRRPWPRRPTPGRTARDAAADGRHVDDC